MRSRHRIPTIFSLSMLDVLCCGLGAVIFLMILNSWDAHRQARALTLARHRVGETAEQLHSASSALAKTQDELEAARASSRTLAAALRAAEADVKALKGEKDRLAALLERLGLEAARLQDGFDDARRRLAQAQQEALAHEEAYLKAQFDLAAARGERDRLQRLAAATADRLAAAEKLKTEAAGQAVLVPTLRAELDSANRRIKDLDQELAALKKQAAEAGLKLTEAQKQGETVLVEVATLRRLLEEQRQAADKLRQRAASAENRFAGIDLSGRRVILLVDMSGSMGYVDERTPDSNKWPEVGRTAAQLLRSMPEVDRFQVLAFSDQVQYPLGRPGEWLTFERGKSPEGVGAALAAVKPSGNTNMYAAFEEAFRFRGQGLDSILVLSDGLPNVGPGLPAQPPVEEGARSALLGKHLRETIRDRWNKGPGAVKIHAVGFFYESPNLGAFLWALTRENGGSFVGMSRP
jgi:predicted  nucleic acid-binding Zn-ribbon protein